MARERERERERALVSILSIMGWSRAFAKRDLFTYEKETSLHII